MGTSRRRTLTAIVIGGVLAAAGCGDPIAEEGAGATEPSVLPPAATSVTAPTSVADTPTPVPSTTASAENDEVGGSDAPPASRLATCAEVPVITTEVIGDDVVRGNIDPIFQGVLLTYAAEHRDAFGGLWIDRDAGGTIVLGFTDDPASRLAELAERRPAADDRAAVEPRPAITDARPIGEWGVPFDVVQVTYTEDELVDSIGPAIDVLQRAGFPVDGGGADIIRNRVGVYLSEPITSTTLAEIERTLVDDSDVPLDRVCIEAEVVDEVPEPIQPGTPLDVIVLPDASGGYPPDTEVACNGIGFPLRSLSDLVPADEVDAGLRAVLDGWLANGEGGSWPQDGWSLLFEDGERAHFVNIDGNAVSFVGAEMGSNGWRWAGASGGGECIVERRLPDGLGAVDWELDPAHPTPDAATTELRLLAIELACTSASELGDRLLGPQVVETDGAVRIAFAAIPLTGAQNCPGNPSTSVVVELDRPLGGRELLDGLTVGPISELVSP